MGPQARDLLALVSPDDFSNAAHPFGTAREVEIGMGLARAHRVTYVGELGWELYVSADQAAHVFETLVEAGAEVGLKLCGLHAMDSARIEKAYRHFGHDITDEDHVLEAGLGFAVQHRQGRASSAATRCCAARRPGSRAGCCSSGSRDPEPLLFHGEPILRDGRIVGHLTSGNYGHALGGAVGPRLCALPGTGRGAGVDARLGLCDRGSGPDLRGPGKPDADVRSPLGTSQRIARGHARATAVATRSAPPAGSRVFWISEVGQKSLPCRRLGACLRDH